MWKILMIILLLLSSCEHGDNNKYDEYFRPDQLNHFPRKLGSDNIITSFFYPKLDNYKHSGAYLRKTYKFNDKVIDTLAHGLRAIDPIIIKHDDSCNLYIELNFNRDLNREIKCDNLFPVPNFWDEMIVLDLKDYKYLPEDFDLYILELKKGKFLPEKNLNNKNNLFGSSEWKNGLSKGVAISKKRNVCIYWLEIW